MLNLVSGPGSIGSNLKRLLLFGANLNYHWIKLNVVLQIAACTIVRIFPKKVELQALMRHYDVDGDGNISYEEFIRGLR